MDSGVFRGAVLDNRNTGVIEWGQKHRKESTMNFYQSMFMFFLLGFGIRLLYIRLNKGWLITLGMAVITAIAWLWFTDEYSYGNEGEAMYGLICTMLLAGAILGEIAVQLHKHRKKKKATENTSKGEPT
jgi:thiol:disulfide interchange protein